MSFWKTPDGCSLFYEAFNLSSARPTIVFLNGSMQTTLYWRAFALKLRERFGVLLYDARGQGNSDLGQAPLNLNLHVGDLIGLLDHLDLGHAHLCGLSHGAYVAYRLALDAPHRVDSLLLTSVSAAATTRGRLIVRSWREILRHGGLEALVWATLPHVFGERFLKENQKMMGHIAQSITRRNKEAHLLAHFEAMAKYRPLGKVLAPLSPRIMVLSGSADPLVPAAGAEKIVQVSSGRHIRLPQLGHSLPAEAPESFLRILVRFIEGH
ncbi:MAG: alpha/beta fold hydrolase [Desulfosarcinaceae bacterium]|nr:alpha/beta fold hydrolase [Desulfosarcinaceae bacterium]